MSANQSKITIHSERIVKDAPPMTIAGLSLTCISAEDMKDAPALWQTLGKYLGNIPGQKGKTTYGLCVELEGGKGIEYITGVEVSGTDNLPEIFVRKQFSSFDYAVFEHKGHVSGISQTCGAIWKDWIPSSGAKKPEGADFFFERYGEGFNPQKGTGDIEIWVPVKV